jgi:DNA-binding response OmpR family regulator
MVRYRSSTSSPKLRSVRILLVTSDDELGHRLHGALPDTDVAVHASLVGLFTAAQKQQAQVVVIDADLPRIAIESAVKFLRAKAETQSLPVLLYTPPPATPDDDPAFFVQTCGANLFVEKSDDIAPLKRALRTLVPSDPWEPTSTETQRKTSGEGKPTVLVVDDDPMIAKLLEKILASRYSVIAVFDGASAIAECRAKKPDAVFCDLRMPNISGPDVYRAVTSTDPSLGARFVFVTAYREEAAVDFFRSLPNRIIKKPFTMREVLAAAEHVLAPAT